MINTKVVSTITLEVQVPLGEINIRDFDDSVIDYAVEETEGLEYTGSVAVTPSDLLYNIAGHDNVRLAQFLNEVRDTVRPVADKVDRVLFYGS